MRALSISAAWEETKAIIVREAKLLAAVALALMVLPQAVLAVIGVPAEAEGPLGPRLAYIGATLLGFVAQIAINRLAIGPSVTVGEAVRIGFTRLLPVFGALFLIFLGLMIVAVVLAIILGAANLVTIPAAGQTPPLSLVFALLALTVVTFAIFQLVFPIAAMETANPFRLISRSWTLARGHYLRLLGFIIFVFGGLILVALVNQFVFGSLVLLTLGRPAAGSLAALLLGLIGGILQSAFAVPAAVMLARIYLQLVGRKETQSGLPSTGI